MPYDELPDLPDRVRNNLPKHAQEIYEEAFNSAEEQYGRRAAPTGSPGERGGEQIREVRER